MNVSLVEILLGADVVAQGIIAILFLLSIWSLAIILEKLIQYNKALNKNKEFDEILFSSNSLYQINDRAKRMSGNVSIMMVQAAVAELAKNNIEKSLKASIKERVWQSFNIIKSRNLEKLEDKLPILAVIGSNSPFIALLGMVWSVANSFRKIAGLKQVSMSVMAPSMVEAFLVTAVGLFVAIVSMVMYELLVSKLDKIENEINNNSIEIYNLLSQEIDEK